MRGPDELRGLVERHLDELALTPELGGLGGAVRYGLAGGKRIRGVLCLATGEALESEPGPLLPAAAGLELVQAFSLVHDDLPALDDDRERRGRPSTWAAHGEDVAILAGDALLAEAFRLAASYSTPDVARELSRATLEMIGGQYLDVTGDTGDVARLHRLKTGALFAASIGCALAALEVSERDQAPWRAFAAELGPLFQAVDDLLDGDGSVAAEGPARARERADAAADSAQARLDELDADTSVLSEIVAGLATRTS